MPANFEYAYNFWRKVFVDSADGLFSKGDFDKWLRGGAKPIASSLEYIGTVDVDMPGSKEHFDQLIRMVFVDMLNACAEGRFGR